MPDVVAQRDRLGQRLVEVQRGGQRARHLGDLHGVRQARHEVVSLGVQEDLGLVLQPAERLRVDDPVAVTLEGRAVLVRLLRPLAPSARRRTSGDRAQALLIGLARDPVATLKSARAAHLLHGPMMHRRSAGAPDRIRTCDLRLRRPTLYPLSYRRVRETDDRRRPPPKRGPSLLPDSLIARASFTHGFPYYPNPNLPMALRPVVNRCANSTVRIDRLFPFDKTSAGLVSFTLQSGFLVAPQAFSRQTGPLRHPRRSRSSR